MNLPFTSLEAKEVNELIFETIYYAALEKSMIISKERLNDITILKQHYNFNNWSFTDTNPECRTYEIYNITDASSDTTVKTDEQIKNLLQKHLPIKAEIDDLENDFIGAYSSFKGSPLSEGILQFDLWESQPISKRYDWQLLKENIIKYGCRNSLLAPLPTASTSQFR